MDLRLALSLQGVLVGEHRSAIQRATDSIQKLTWCRVNQLISLFTPLHFSGVTLFLTWSFTSAFYARFSGTTGLCSQFWHQCSLFSFFINNHTCILQMTGTFLRVPWLPCSLRKDGRRGRGRGADEGWPEEAPSRRVVDSWDLLESSLTHLQPDSVHLSSRRIRAAGKESSFSWGTSVALPSRFVPLLRLGWTSFRLINQ